MEAPRLIRRRRSDAAQQSAAASAADPHRRLGRRPRRAAALPAAIVFGARCIGEGDCDGVSERASSEPLPGYTHPGRRFVCVDAAAAVPAVTALRVDSRRRARPRQRRVRAASTQAARQAPAPPSTLRRAPRAASATASARPSRERSRSRRAAREARALGARRLRRRTAVPPPTRSALRVTAGKACRRWRGGRRAGAAVDAEPADAARAGTWAAESAWSSPSPAGRCRSAGRVGVAADTTHIACGSPR